MERVAFDLRWPSVVRLHDERNGAAARRHSRGKKLWHTVRVVFWLLRKRQNCFHWPPAPGRPQAPQQKGGGHDLDKMPPRNRISELARASRKLSFHPLTKLRCVSQLIQAAPILRTGIRFRTGWRDGLHR